MERTSTILAAAFAAALRAGDCGGATEPAPDGGVSLAEEMARLDAEGRGRQATVRALVKTAARGATEEERTAALTALRALEGIRPPPPLPPARAAPP